jgi:hypothetical protein
MLEKEFVSHLPELQEAFLTEVSAFVKSLSEWVESKMSNQKGVDDEKKGS